MCHGGKFGKRAMKTFNEKLSHYEAETFFYLDKKLEDEEKEEPEDDEPHWEGL
jgi:hypothetical protein